MPRTAKLLGVIGFSSMFTLATVSLPASSPAISSSAGPIALQGPHHSAQKSTSTGPVAFSTSVAKLSSVTGLVFSLMICLGFQLNDGWKFGDRPNGLQGADQAGGGMALG